MSTRFHAAVLLAAIAAAPAAAEGLEGTIWLPASSKAVGIEALMERVQAAGIVILGESHDNPRHHALQARMVERIAAAGRRPVTAFEMIDTDQQAKLTAARSDLAGLGETMDWERRGWPDWAWYRPIAEATLAAGGDLVAANLPRDLGRQIARQTEAADTTERFGLDTPLPPAEAEAMAEDIRTGHCNLLPEPAIAGMVRVQRARDAAMAETLAEQAARPEVSPVVLIAGAGHARTDHGVPARLHALVPGIVTFSVAFIEVEEGQTAPASYAGQFGAKRLPFDAVWFTPRAEREAPCAQMERQMKKK